MGARRVAIPKHVAGRIVELDGMRGIAALGVVAFHYCVRINELYPEVDAVLSLTRFGILGVPIFFVLSGYVISLSTGGRSTREFLTGRAARLLPTYWFAVTFTYVGVLLFSLPGREVRFVEFLANYLLFARLAGVPDVDGVYWSLALEALFYLAVATAISLSLWERRQIHILIAWVSIAIGWSVFGFAGEPGVPGNVSELLALVGYFALVEYAGYFVGGAALQLSHRGLIGFPAMVGIVVAAGISSWLHGGLSYFLALAVTVAVIDVSKHRGIALLRSTTLVWAGTISYALYLLHQNLGFIALRALDRVGVPRLSAIFVVFLGALGVAQLVHHLVEQPAARWLRGRRAKRADQIDGSSSASVLSSEVRR